MRLKEEIAEILFAIYRVPGEFAIGSIISFGFWKAMKDLTNWSLVFLLLSIFLIIMEVLTPFIAGFSVYKRIFK